MKKRAQTNGSNYRTCPRFYAAILEYGWNNFSGEIIESVETKEEANLREQYYIKLYRTNDGEHGYNIEIGGDCGPSSEYSQRLISDAAKQRYKDKTKNPMYGKKHSAAAIKKMSEMKKGKKNLMYGKHWNENQRKNSGKHGWCYEITPERRRRFAENARERFSKPVKCVETNEIFPSATSAAQKYGVTISTLSGHLKGRQHTCCGKHFVYIEKR